MGPSRVLTCGLCPGGLPEIMTIAYVCTWSVCRNPIPYYTPKGPRLKGGRLPTRAKTDLNRP